MKHPLHKFSLKSPCHHVIPPLLQNHHLAITSPPQCRQLSLRRRRSCFPLLDATAPHLYFPLLAFCFCCVIFFFFGSVSNEIKCELGLGCLGVILFYYWVKFGWQFLNWWGLEGRGREGRKRVGAGERVEEWKEILIFFKKKFTRIKLKWFIITKTKIILKLAYRKVTWLSSCTSSLNGGRIMVRAKIKTFENIWIKIKKN